jgi:cobalamin biosynthetic protein CobC
MLPVAGTQAAIQALPRLRAPSRVTVAAPSYAEHAHHWSQHGHTLRQIGYPMLDAAVGSSDVVVVCNPNNPTGATVPPAVLLGWAAELGARGGWLVVDEAFGDTTPALSVAAHAGQPGLVVLRSVGKFFGLAGLRLGFVAAEAPLLAALADLLGPWTVSGPAQQIGLAALRDTGWQQAARLRLARDGARLRGLLAAHGIQAAGTPLLHWWPEAQPEAFHEHMARRAIWVRLFRQAARGIRLGLPARARLGPHRTRTSRMEPTMNTSKALILFAALAACQAQAAITVKDDDGNLITLQKPAQRVISLAPHVTEMLFAAGGGSHVVGVVAYSDFPEDAKKIPQIGSNREVDLERIMALKPDLIVVWRHGSSERQIEMVRKLGVPMFHSEPQSLEAIADSVAKLGQLMGTENAAGPAAAELRRSWPACAAVMRTGRRCGLSTRSGTSRCIPSTASTSSAMRCACAAARTSSPGCR